MGLPIIRIQDLTGNTYDLGFYDGEYPSKIEINDGDVLISWSASLGVYVWNRGKALLNQHIFKVTFDKVEIDKNYFVYAVKSTSVLIGSEKTPIYKRNVIRSLIFNLLYAISIAPATMTFTCISVVKTPTPPWNNPI